MWMRSPAWEEVDRGRAVKDQRLGADGFLELPVFFGQEHQHVCLAVLGGTEGGPRRKLREEEPLRKSEVLVEQAVAWNDSGPTASKPAIVVPNTRTGLAFWTMCHLFWRRCPRRPDGDALDAPHELLIQAAGPSSDPRRYTGSPGSYLSKGASPVHLSRKRSAALAPWASAGGGEREPRSRVVPGFRYSQRPERHIVRGAKEARGALIAPDSAAELGHARE